MLYLEPLVKIIDSVEFWLELNMVYHVKKSNIIILPTLPMSHSQNFQRKCYKHFLSPQA